MVSTVKSFPYVTKGRFILGDPSTGANERKTLRAIAENWISLFRGPVRERELVSSEAFLRTLEIETIRSERSGKQFALVVLRGPEVLGTRDLAVIRKFSTAILSTVRDIDLVGWYEDGVALGIICREVGPDCGAASKAIVARLKQALEKNFQPTIVDSIAVTWHLCTTPVIKASIPNTLRKAAVAGLQQERLT